MGDDFEGSSITVPAGAEEVEGVAVALEGLDGTDPVGEGEGEEGGEDEVGEAAGG